MTAPMDPPGFPDPRQYPATDAGFLAALVALGNTVHAVATTLDAGGWHGLLGSCSGCPVALYLTDVVALPPDTQMSVTRETAFFTDLSGCRAAYAVLPIPVRQFVAKFDTGMLPGLIGAV